MNIAIVSYHGCPVARLGEKDTGGMNVYVLNMAKELSKLGNNVENIKPIYQKDYLVHL